MALSCEAGAEFLWLEVRQSNRHARAAYERYGFEAVGCRRSYYPAAAGTREDACVMRLAVAARTSEARDALD